MKATARVALDAHDVRSAAEAVAGVAATCGDCHEALAMGPRFEAPPLPDDREGVGWHMARHRWAADRMWAGMLQPSEIAWDLGVAALDEAPLQGDEVPSHEGLSPDEAAVAGWLHEMSEFGAHMQSPDAKVRFYGEVLGNCASCHATARAPR